MKILFEYSGRLPVTRYGGTERVVLWLMKELVGLGHEVFLIADSRSEVSDFGIKLIAHPGDDTWKKLIPSNIDILHSTYPILDVGVPVIVTIHGNGQIAEEFPKNTVFVSQKHALNHGSCVYVHNGLDLSEYPFCPPEKKSWENFLFLAKASWKVKNLKDCIRAAKASKKHLHIAGGRHFSFSPYIHSHGIVDQEKKLELLRKTDALLWPVRWHEPFGIAMIEAFSQGRPVIASSFGSMPEIITPKAGILCSSFEEFAQAFEGQNHFSPEEIRHYVEENFSSLAMAKRYLDFYEKVIRGESLSQKVPKWNLSSAPQELLNF